MLIVGLDVGSTTVKAAVVDGRRACAGRTTSATTPGRPRWCSSSSARMEAECGLAAGPRSHLLHRLGRRPARAAGRRQDGAGGGRGGGGGREAAPRRELRLRDRRRGHEDAVLHAQRRRQEQAGLHAVGLQRRHRHLHREDRAQAAGGAASSSAQAGYAGYSLHKISSKCGIFAEADANTLVKSGVPVEEIIASLFEAVVYQNLATLTKGNTPTPERAAAGRPEPVLPRPAGGLAPSSRQAVGGAQDRLPIRRPARSSGAGGGGLLRLPRLHRDRRGRGRAASASTPAATGCAGGSTKGQWEAKAKDGRAGRWCRDQQDLASLRGRRSTASDPRPRAPRRTLAGPVLVGCDFGSTTAKAVVLSPERELLFSCYALSNGNPIEDAKALFRQLREAGFDDDRRRSRSPATARICCKDVIGADVGDRRDGGARHRARCTSFPTPT